MGYSGHKHQKGEKIVSIGDNIGNIIAHCESKPVNINDSKLLPDSLKSLKQAAKILAISLDNLPITFDSGFDSEENHSAVYKLGMIRVIKPNLRNAQNPALIDARQDFFGDIETLYKERNSVERSFAWEDVYRKLVIRYERLQSTFMGFRYLAYAMINYRSEFGKT